jgi:hypothetical protein
MFIFFLGFFVGSFITLAGIVVYFAYHYCKALKEAHDEGWDMPN